MLNPKDILDDCDIKQAAEIMVKAYCISGGYAEEVEGCLEPDYIPIVRASSNAAGLFLLDDHPNPKDAHNRYKDSVEPLYQEILDLVLEQQYHMWNPNKILEDYRNSQLPDCSKDEETKWGENGEWAITITEDDFANAVEEGKL